MKYRHLIIFFFFAAVATAQTEPHSTAYSTKTKDTIVNGVIERRPEYPGGIAKFYEYISKHFKVPKNFEGSGQIIVEFIVEKDGTLTGIQVVKDIGQKTAEEAIRVMKKSKKWTAGMQNGKPVRVKFSLPIKIQSAE
jgi:protein TonB